MIRASARRTGKRTERDGARMHWFWIGREAEANAEIDAEANRGDEIFAGNFADFLSQRERSRDYRDRRFVSDPVVVDVELEAVVHGGVHQRGRRCREFFTSDEDRAFVAASTQSLRASARLLDARCARAGENRSKCIEDVLLGRAQRIAIEGVESSACQIPA